MGTVTFLIGRDSSYRINHRDILALVQRSGPVHVVIDATGLKVHGAGEWLAEKYGERGRRTWRKLV